MKTAIALARESSDNKTLQNQYDDIKASAKNLGYRIVEYIGENVSGDVTRDGSGDDSEFINKLRRSIEESKPDAIFAWYIDRITRTPFKQGAYLDEFSVTLKIPIYFVRSKKWTINPENGIIDFEYINEVATDTTPWKEKENIVARTRPRREEVGSEGYYIGHLSDGYRVDVSFGKYEDGKRRVIKEIKPDDNRKEVIIKIFSLYLEGKSTNQIASILNAEGVDTTNKYRANHPEMFGYKDTYKPRGSKAILDRNSAKWDGSAVANILKNEWYIGKRTYRGQEHFHEAIITNEQWEKAKSIREEKEISHSRKSQKNRTLLSGLMYCGKCGSKLYCHHTGENHYYCSSSERGDKCGLRGVTKENVEACIYEIITMRAYNAAFEEGKNLFTNFFRLDDSTIKQIKKDIINDKKLIEASKAEISNSKKAILTYMKQQGKYGDNAEMVDKYDSLIVEENKNIHTLDAKIISAEARIRKNESRKRSAKGIEPILTAIQAKKSLDEVEALFRAVIDEVVVYNADVNCSVIRVKYLNGRYDEFIYAPRLMRTGYILLSPFNDKYKMLCYDESSNLIHALGYPFFYSGGSVMFCSVDNPEETEREAALFEADGITLHRFDCDFPVETWVKLTRKTKLEKHYERLEGLSERAILKKTAYKEWRKKYNTGKPTQVPYVLRDANYVEICKERKKLYNKIYKIKNRKRLTDEERSRLIEPIRERLSILAAQVKYIPKD